MTSPAFVRAESALCESVANGVRRQIMGHGPDLMMVTVQFLKGAVGALHRHPHRQVTYVAAGEFEVTVGADTTILRAGDCFFAPANVDHGVVALADGVLVDVFTPAREDFLPPPAPA